MSVKQNVSYETFCFTVCAYILFHNKYLCAENFISNYQIYAYIRAIFKHLYAIFCAVYNKISAKELEQ